MSRCVIDLYFCGSDGKTVWESILHGVLLQYLGKCELVIQAGPTATGGEAKLN